MARKERLIDDTDPSKQTDAEYPDPGWVTLTNLHLYIHAGRGVMPTKCEYQDMHFADIKDFVKWIKDTF